MAAKRGVKRSSKFAASPARLEERSRKYSNGTSARQNYNRSTYGPADVSEPSHFSSGTSGNYDSPSVPTRKMAGGRPRIGGGSLSADSQKRRKASTNNSLRSADVSMMQAHNLEPGQRIEPSSWRREPHPFSDSSFNIIPGSHGKAEDRDIKKKRAKRNKSRQIPKGMR